MSSQERNDRDADAHRVWQAILRDNFRHPHNRAAVQGMEHCGSSRNPLCGDHIEVGIDEDHGVITDVRFTGYACSIAVASASLMTQAVQGSTTDMARELADGIQQWFSDDSVDLPLPGLLQPLRLLRRQSARKRCAMLAWQSLAKALP